MRRRYALAAIVLPVVLVLIALFVHDRWLRPYGGALPRLLLLLYVFLFAALWEGLQAADIVSRLGLSGSRFFRILLGSTFSVPDLFCYAGGCLLLAGIDMIFRKKQKNY